jgi:hypothetical protein
MLRLTAPYSLKTEELSRKKKQDIRTHCERIRLIT